MQHDVISTYLSKTSLRPRQHDAKRLRGCKDTNSEWFKIAPVRDAFQMYSSGVEVERFKTCGWEVIGWVEDGQKTNKQSTCNQVTLFSMNVEAARSLRYPRWIGCAYAHH